MNLIELSKKVNQPIEMLKKKILDDFGIIILSEFNTVQDGVIRHFLNSDLSVSADDNSRKGVNEGKVSSVNDERSCLDELTNIQHPELAYTKKLLKYCIDKKFLIFVDTCSLLNDNFDDFFKIYLYQKESSCVNLYIPYVVIEELKRIIVENKKEKAIVDKAIKVLQFIQTEEEKHNIVMVGNESDKRSNERGEKVIHADRVIIEKLIFFRNDSRSSLFITQDFDATVDALKQNDWHSSKSNALILVKKITKGGALVNNTKETVNPTLPID